MDGTSVITKLSEFKPAKATKSMLQLIKEASTTTELKYFMGLGKGYKTASSKTRKMWEKAAEERQKILSK